MPAAAIDEKILDRIQKLLALADSPNEHEAALAASRAQELLTKHNLSVESLRMRRTKNDTTHTDIDGPAEHGISRQWFFNLGNAVAEGCFCLMLWSGWDQKLTFIGRPEDVQVSIALFGYLKSQVLRALDNSYGDKPEWMNRRAWKNGFLLGCSARVATRLKLEAMERRRDEQVAGLVRLADTENRGYGKEHLNMGRSVRASVNAEHRAARAGADAGDRISLRPTKELDNAPKSLRA